MKSLKFMIIFGNKDSKFMPFLFLKLQLSKTSNLL